MRAVERWQHSLRGGNRGQPVYSGALWVFTRSSGVWTQQGSKLTSSGVITNVAASGDGNTALAAGTIPFGANGYLGGTWMFTRNTFPGTNSGTWSLLGRIDDSGQEAPLAVSSDGSTALLVGGATGPGQVSVLTRVVAPPSQPGRPVFLRICSAD